jgi:hypothetical protein
MGFDWCKAREFFCDYRGSASGVTEVKDFFNHTLITFSNCSRLVAAVIVIGGGLPVFPLSAPYCVVASVLAESLSMAVALKVAKELRVTTTFWGGGSTASVHAVGPVFLEVGAVSSVLCLFRLWTSLKPSFWVAADFGVLAWLAGVLALSTAFNSWWASLYVPQKALNMVFPLKPLQKICLFSSAEITMADHCSLSPTEPGVSPSTASMSPGILNSWFSCASASGNCPVKLWYSDFKFERLFVQNGWYTGTGQSQSLTRHSFCSSHLLVCHPSNFTEEQCPQLAHSIFWVNVEVRLNNTRWEPTRSNAMTRSSHWMQSTLLTTRL